MPDVMRALLESADGLKAWFIVPIQPPRHYILPLMEPLRAAPIEPAVPPPSLGVRRYELLEIREAVTGEKYAYYRENLF